jgi:hypothetical protein
MKLFAGKTAEKAMLHDQQRGEQDLRNFASILEIQDPGAI